MRSGCRRAQEPGAPAAWCWALDGVPHADRADPDRGGRRLVARGRVVRILGSGDFPGGGCGAQADVRRLPDRRGRERGDRDFDRLGARPGRLPGPERRQRGHRPAVRAADDRGRADAPRRLRAREPSASTSPIRERRSSWRSSSSRSPSSSGPCSRCSRSSTARWRKRRRRSARDR